MNMLYYHLVAHYERWGLLDSVYFVTVTTFSVGYGDFHPTKDYTRTFASFYMIFGLIYVATFVGELTKGKPIATSIDATIHWSFHQIQMPFYMLKISLSPLEWIENHIMKL
jgi:hypothetical protein